MVEAALSVPRKFYLLPPAQNLGLALTLSLCGENGTAIVGSPFAATLITAPSALGVLGVYETAPVTFPAVGAYRGVWSATGVKVTFDLSVLNTPVADFGLGLGQKAFYSSPNFVAVTDLVLKVYDASGTLIQTSATAVTSTAGVYVTVDEVLITAPGSYLFAWTSVLSGYAVAKAETKLALPVSDLRSLQVYVIDVVPSPQVPQVGVEVLLSKLDGTPLQQRLTNDKGLARLSARNGNYVISIRKSGVTWSKNNLAIAATNPASGPNANRFYLFATPFAATFDPAPLFDISATSLMTVDLADMSGRPLSFVPILVSNHSTPDVLTGLGGKTVGLVGPPIAVQTDGNGHAEVRLMRGQRVTVAFENTSVRRTITVPDLASFALLPLLTAANDPFDVVIPNIATAVRMS